MAEKIVVVDDEASIVTLLEYNLKRAGYDVLAANDGPGALRLAEREKPDLMVLDLMLPGMSGFDVCRQMREKRLMIPVIMLTAKDGEVDKVRGLELGADDYITKPFSPREVVARVKAVLRRSAIVSEETTEPQEERLTVGELTIYPDNYEAYFRGKVMELTPKEFELLVYLARNRGRALSREKLLNAVWNYEFVGDTRIVDVHVSHLREKIETNTRKPAYIKTVRGFGYKMEEP